MATTIDPKTLQTPAPQPSPVTPDQPGPVSTEKVAVKPAVAPASGFQQGARGLQGKFAVAPSLRANAFRGGPSIVGLNRPSNVLGPNNMTVGDLLGRIGEHLEDPGNPTAHDLALMNGAFNVVA